MYPNDGNVLVKIQAQYVLIIAVPYSKQPSAIQQSDIYSCQIKHKSHCITRLKIFFFFFFS